MKTVAAAIILAANPAWAADTTLPNFESFTMQHRADDSVFTLYDDHGAVSARLTYGGALILNAPMTPEEAARKYNAMSVHGPFCLSGATYNYIYYFSFMDNNKTPHTGWTVRLRSDGSVEYTGLTPDWQTQQFFTELARLEKCAPTT